MTFSNCKEYEEFNIQGIKALKMDCLDPSVFDCLEITPETNKLVVNQSIVEILQHTSKLVRSIKNPPDSSKM